MDSQYTEVVRAFTGVLGGRPVALTVYGSAVTCDAFPGLSDLDLFVVVRDALTLEDALALQRLMPEPQGVAYVQPSYREAGRPQQHLVPGAFRVLPGDLPAGFVMDEPALRRAGLDTLRELPTLVA